MRSISLSRFIDLHDIQKQQCIEFTYVIMCFYSFNYSIKNVSIFVNRCLYINCIFVELETKNNDASKYHHNSLFLKHTRYKLLEIMIYVIGLHIYVFTNHKLSIWVISIHIHQWYIKASAKTHKKLFLDYMKYFDFWRFLSFSFRNITVDDILRSIFLTFFNNRWL